MSTPKLHLNADEHNALADANQPAGIEGQIRHLIACVREDVLAHDGKLAARAQLAEERLKALIALAVKNASKPLKFKDALHSHFNEFPIPTQLGVLAIMKHIEKVYAEFVTNEGKP